MSETLALMPLWGFAAAMGIAFVAGFIKGAVGFAMPLVIISGLTLYLDPVLAIAGLIAPTVVSNIWQALRHGWAQVRQTMWDFRRYIVLVCIAILVAAQFVTLVVPETYYLILGIPVIILSIVQLLGLRLRIPPHRRVLADWLIGPLAGGLGGFSGTWGPPTVLYLMAIDTPKARAMMAQGVVYGIGSVSLLAGHIQSGVITTVTIPFTLSLLPAALLGQAVGFRMSDRMDQESIRRLTLIVLVIAGANLIRRGLFS